MICSTQLFWHTYPISISASVHQTTYVEIQMQNCRKCITYTGNRNYLLMLESQILKYSNNARYSEKEKKKKRKGHHSFLQEKLIPFMFSIIFVIVPHVFCCLFLISNTISYLKYIDSLFFKFFSFLFHVWMNHSFELFCILVFMSWQRKPVGYSYISQIIGMRF